MSFFFFLLLPAHFSVLFVSPPVRFALRCVLFIETEFLCVCVWSEGAVIEPICRLAPVGLKPRPGRSAAVKCFAMFL